MRVENFVILTAPHVGLREDSHTVVLHRRQDGLHSGREPSLVLGEQLHAVALHVGGVPPQASHFEHVGNSCEKAVGADFFFSNEIVPPAGLEKLELVLADDVPLDFLAVPGGDSDGFVS